MSAEVGRSPVDPNAAFQEIYRVIKDEAAWIVEDQNGLEVASLGVVQQPGHWYSPHTAFFSEQWFYVLPGLRADGAARKMLEAELSALCDLTGLPAFIKYFDPRKLASDDRKLWVGDEKGYIPTGRLARINPFGVPQVNEG
jgi:GNAT superfamily N-acetyltransferase